MCLRVSRFTQVILGVIGLIAGFLLLDGLHFFSYLGISSNVNRYSHINYPSRPEVDYLRDQFICRRQANTISPLSHSLGKETPSSY